MNMQPMSNVQAPPACKTMEDTGLTPVTMRDILLKTMFRMNLETVTDLERVLAVPSRVVQDLVDAARTLGMVEAMGTLHANSGGEMGYRLSDTGKARALDALAREEGARALEHLARRARGLRRALGHRERARVGDVDDEVGHATGPIGQLAGTPGKVGAVVVEVERVRRRLRGGKHGAHQVIPPSSTTGASRAAWGRAGRASRSSPGPPRRAPRWPSPGR